jgi:hypothetical protein
MKCPKCGYNSFESLTACKKCSHDLTALKEKHGLKPIVLQMETRAAMVAAMAAEATRNAAPQQSVEQPSDMFSFDIPDEETNAPESKTSASVDFFNFSEKPVAAPSDDFGNFSFDDDQDIKKPATRDDAFASLLESTPRGSSAGAATPSAASASAPAGSPDEFDLDNFSWDETPGATAASNKKSDDDFKSLFGEISAGTKK